jgi:hypothetical protein
MSVIACLQQLTKASSAPEFLSIPELFFFFCLKIYCNSRSPTQIRANCQLTKNSGRGLNSIQTHNQNSRLIKQITSSVLGFAAIVGLLASSPLLAERTACWNTRRIIARYRSMGCGSFTEKWARKMRRRFFYCTDFPLHRECLNPFSPGFPKAITWLRRITLASDIATGQIRSSSITPSITSPQ